VVSKKIQSQQKNAKRQADAKRQAGQDNKAAAQVKLTVVCKTCKTTMPDLKTYKQHFINKHPKLEIPDEIKEVAM